jgi:Protein of unknown function (DUF2934)
LEVDIETLRKKQQALMMQLVERRVRARAQQLYQSRGCGDGRDLQDWFQAESEVLENSILAPLYWRFRGAARQAPEKPAGGSFSPATSTRCENL